MKPLLFTTVLAYTLAVPMIASPRPRLCATTDIGGDPDDTQSLIRLLVCANEFELEGLLPTSSGTPGERTDASPRPFRLTSPGGWSGA